MLEELLTSNPIRFDQRLHSSLPNKSGVYRIFEIISQDFKSVYVGKSVDLQNRIHGNHLMGNRRGSTLKRKLIENNIFLDEEAVKNYLKHKCLVQYILVPDDCTLNGFEHFAIAILQPKIND